MRKRSLITPFARLGAPRCTRCAFTLIELLVVIAILILLIALFIPNLRNMMSRTHIVTCANNLKEIGKAVHGRKADGQDRPDLIEGHWVVEIIKYLDSGDVLICPEGLSAWAATQSVEDQIDIKSGSSYIPLVVGPKMIKLSDNQWLYTVGIKEVHTTEPVPYDPDDGSNGVYWWGWEDGSDNDFQDMAIRVTPLPGGWADVWVQSGTAGSPELWTKPPRECLAVDIEINGWKYGTDTFKEFQFNVGGECSYGMNNAMLKLSHPTRILALDYGAVTAKSTDVWADPKWDTDGDGELDFARHLGRINVLLVNGSVKLKTVDQINPASPTAARTHWDP